MSPGSGEHTRVFVADLRYHDDRAAGLVSAHQAGVPDALAQIRTWHPSFAAADDGMIRATPFDVDAARLVYARQHGCPHWPAFAGFLRDIASGARAEPLRDAFQALEAHDWAAVRAVLHAHPEVLRVRGTNGNTLLNLAASIIGMPGATPSEAALHLVDGMIGSGADVDAANDRGWTPLHQAGYANQVAVAERLLAGGASVDRQAHGEGGTPLAVALFWGHREVADVLAAVAVVPANLRVAAGAGRADLVDAAFTREGSLTDAARRGRGFYRPHSGFPVWQPADDPQEVLDEALVWAAKAGRDDVLARLVGRGADVDADPYRGTALLWATWTGRLSTVRWLLDHGADVNRRATFGGTSHGHGVTALHLAAQCHRVDVARVLIERGADPTIADAIYNSTPAGWAEHFGATAVRALL